MADNLSTPRGIRRRQYDPEMVGRLAETFARFLGTGRYLAVQTIVVVIWITMNVWGFTHHFDKYPFILLNLVFSTQAAYAAPLILLAQNRQADRDRQQTERDRETNARSLASMDFLAREIASIRISIDKGVNRDEMEEMMDRLADRLLHPVMPSYDAIDQNPEPVLAGVRDSLSSPSTGDTLDDE
jgi:uncharacterized membrane protein